MTMTVAAEGGSVRITLIGALSVADVKAMHATLLAHVSQESTVTLCAERVERADTAVVQLVFALRRHVRELHVEAASEVWTRAWRFAGFEDEGAASAPEASL